MTTLKLLKEKMMKAANDNQAAWQEFHDANPGVYSLVEHFTKQVIDAGFKHYGMMSDRPAGALAYIH